MGDQTHLADAKDKNFNSNNTKLSVWIKKWLLFFRWFQLFLS